jgi:hypothetical protein
MILTMAISAGILAIPSQAHSAEFVVYSVYRGLDMGIPGETPQKDFYVNIGAAQGVRVGTTLEVMRRASTYDLITEKLYKDLTYPIARLKDPYRGAVSLKATRRRQPRKACADNDRVNHGTVLD